MPTHYRKLREDPGRWLGQWSLPIGRDVVVIIEKVEPYVSERKQRRRMPDGTYREEQSKRVIITFRGKQKQWLAGPVSQAAIASMYGPYIEGWIGKPISLFVDTEVEFGKQKTGGIRVRPTPPRIGEKPTTDPLDRPVDEAKAKQIEDAAAVARGDDHG